MNIPWKEYGIIIAIGIGTAIIATLPLFFHPMYISNHGDINRALVYDGIARSSILSGHLPLWNQYICGGSPLWGDLESWFLQPLFFLTLPFHEIVALKITYTATLAIAYVGFTLFARKILRFQLIGSVVFAIVTTYGGYLSQHLAEGYYVWIASAYIPWFLLFAGTAYSSRKYIPLAGSMLALMFTAGSMHLVVFSVLYLAVVYTALSYQKPKRSFVKAYVSICIFFVLFAAIKLLPALSLLGIDASREGFTPSLLMLPHMLFERGVASAVVHDGVVYRFAEFGNYIGLAGLLTIGGIVVGKKKLFIQYRPYLIASIAMFCIAFIPLPVMHGFISHITDLFRMPSRVMMFPLIGIAICAAFFAEYIAQKREGILWGIALICIVALDLISNDYQLFSRTFSVPLPEIHTESKFMRVSNAYTTPDETYYRAVYVDYLEHRGTNDVCRFYQASPAPHPIDSSDPRLKDFGEAYFTDKDAGAVAVTERENGAMAVSLDIKAPTTLIVNQNYYPGWKTLEHIAVRNSAGLIAVPVTPSLHSIHLVYRPDVVYWGILISIIALIVGILYVV